MSYPHSYLNYMEAVARKISVERNCARMLIGDVVEHLKSLSNDKVSGNDMLDFIQRQRVIYDNIEKEMAEIFERAKEKFSASSH